MLDFTGLHTIWYTPPWGGWVPLLLIGSCVIAIIAWELAGKLQYKRPHNHTYVLLAGFAVVALWSILVSGMELWNRDTSARESENALTAILKDEYGAVPMNRELLVYRIRGEGNPDRFDNVVLVFKDGSSALCVLFTPQEGEDVRIICGERKYPSPRGSGN